VRNHIIRLLQSHGYTTSWQVLNTKGQGIPQSRPRFYLVAIKEPENRFEFPPPIPEEPLRSFLDKHPKVQDHTKANVNHPTFQAAHQQAALKCGRLGINYKEMDVIMDALASSKWACSMVHCCPCLTASRCKSGGHYLMNKERFLTWQEMCRLQGLPPTKVDFHAAGVELRDFRHAVGNAMSVNVLMRLLLPLLYSAGLRKSPPTLPTRFRHLMGK
jgi:site-specific DNA-cytosine methylase